MTTPQATVNTAAPVQANTNLVLVLSYLLFIVLGLPDGFLGAVNPSIREFGIGTEDWWLLALAGTLGYTISTSLLGKVMARFFDLPPSWWWQHLCVPCSCWLRSRFRLAGDRGVGALLGLLRRLR